MVHSLLNSTSVQIGAGFNPCCTPIPNPSRRRCRARKAGDAKSSRGNSFAERPESQEIVEHFEPPWQLSATADAHYQRVARQLYQQGRCRVEDGSNRTHRRSPPWVAAPGRGFPVRPACSRCVPPSRIVLLREPASASRLLRGAVGSRPSRGARLPCGRILEFHGLTARTLHPPQQAFASRPSLFSFSNCRSRLPHRRSPKRLRPEGYPRAPTFRR
jgi:hypothetical protein